MWHAKLNICGQTNAISSSFLQYSSYSVATLKPCSYFHRRTVQKLFVQHVPMLCMPIILDTTGAMQVADTLQTAITHRLPIFDYPKEVDNVGMSKLPQDDSLLEEADTILLGQVWVQQLDGNVSGSTF